MTDHSVNAPTTASNPIIEWVKYEGTDALKEGEGVCYNTDYGTATDRDGRRVNHVERPSLGNNMAFAGVAARDYPARSTGQFIEINVPGSKGVNVALSVDTVLNTGLLTFVAGASGSHRGRFYTGFYRGRGTAEPRQTVTALLEADVVGAWSLGTDGVTLTVTATAGITAGDTCVLVGGEDEGTSKNIVPGKYNIASVTDGTTLVLSSSAVGATPGAALTCMGYIYTANPKCQADLLTGDESGGIDFLSIPNAGDAGLTDMVGGLTYVVGGVTIAADGDVVFAQGTYHGQKKGFILLGDLTTSDFTLDLATAGLSLDGSTALGEVLTIDDDGDGWYGVFNGAKWHSEDLLVGATEGAT